MDSFAQFLKKNNLLTTSIAERRQEIKVAQLPTNPAFAISSKHTISCKVPAENSNSFSCDQLKKQAADEGFNGQFARIIPPGEVNPLINVNFIRTGGNHKDRKRVDHQIGEVLLVIFRGGEALVDYMIQKMAKNAATWDKVVRAVIIGYRYYQSQKIEQLQLDCDCSCNFFESQLDVDHNFVCLVNKFGKVDYSTIGDFQFGQFDLQQRINELLVQFQEEPPVVPQQNPVIKPHTEISLILKQNQLEDAFKDTEFVCIQAKLLSTLDRGNYSQRAEIQAYVYEDDEGAAFSLRKLFEGLKKTSLKINKIERVKVPQPIEPKCEGCKNALAYPFYWLYWQKGEKFACTTCVEKRSNNPDQHFSYRKNSILLNGKWDYLLKDDLGQNLQPKDINQGKHVFWCSNCGMSSRRGQARYICLGCRVFGSFTEERLDICQDCQEKDISKELNEKADLKHHEGHPLLRVLYHTKKDKY